MSIIRFTFLEGNCAGCVGIATMPRRGQESILETLPKEEKKAWTVYLPTGGCYVETKQKKCLPGWNPVVIGDIVTLTLLPNVGELKITVRRKTTDEERTWTVSMGGVKSTVMPLHFILPLQSGNVVKFLRGVCGSLYSLIL